MTPNELAAALLAAPTPRPDALARQAGRRLFPTWQALLVGLPLGLIAGALTGCVLALVVALPVAHFVGQPRPPWLGTMSEVVLSAGGALGLLVVALWLVRRRARFVALAREGTVFPTFDVGLTGLGRALGNKVVGAAVELALDGVGSTLRQIYCAPVVAAEVDGTIVEVRTPGDWRGRFPRPSHMIVQPGNPYVALLGQAGLRPQRVRRRRPAKEAGGA